MTTRIAPPAGSRAPWAARCRVAALAGLLTLASACVEETSLAGVAEHYGHNDGPWVTWCGDPTSEACVTWLTRLPQPTTLRWGTDPARLDARYAQERPRHLHRVRLTGLQPDTTYHYAMPVEFDTSVAGEGFRFRTAPAAERPFAFAVVGDLQPETPALIEANRLVADALRELPIDFLVQMGDAAQLGGDELYWRQLFAAFPRATGRHALAAVIGNHDWYGDDGANWEALFEQPWVDRGDGRYYSFDVLGAHLVMLDNFELDEAMGADQLAWLDADLEAARARGAWVFVFMHLSILSTGTSNMKFELQRQLVPLFDRHRVDGVFYGHDHMYEHWVYTYGGSGLVHDPAHTWPHVPVHYWETGGGGALLESHYGLLDREPVVESRDWYDAGTGARVQTSVEVRPWDEGRWVRWAPAKFAPDSRPYYHDTDELSFQDDTALYGHDYGENALHFMIVEVDGAKCTVRAVYPDGTLLSGPKRGKPQAWTFRR